MDQMFWDANGPVLPGFGGMVANGLVSTPEGKKRYFARMREILKTVYQPEELVKRLQSDKDETRRAALREMVQRYVEFEFARRNLPEEQKAALQKQLEEMRKSIALPTGQKFCPSCDGACRLAPKP